jgi:hypothetical protein
MSDTVYSQQFAVDRGLVSVDVASVILSASDEDARRISAAQGQQAVDRLRSFASLRMTVSQHLASIIARTD